MVIGYTAQPFTSIAVVIAIRNLKLHLRFVPLLAIGHTSMLSDPGVLIVDMLGPAGLLHSKICWNGRFSKAPNGQLS
jgi:hypothetical protein